MSSTIKQTIGLHNAFALEVIWEERDINVAANTSKLYILSAKVKKINSSAKPYNDTCAASLKVGSAAAISYSSGYNLSTNAEQIIFSNHFWTINHNNSNGTATVTIEFSFDGSAGLTDWYPFGTLSETVTLSTIPRTDSFSLSSTALTLGSSVTLTHTSNLPYHKFQFIYGTRTDSTSIFSTTPSSVTPTTAFAGDFPKNAKTVNATARLYSYATASGAAVGYKDVTITLTIPNTTGFTPTFSHTLSAYSDLPIAKAYCDATGRYIQNVTGARLNITSAAARNGATLAKAELVLSDWTPVVKSGNSATYHIDSGIFTKDLFTRTLNAKVTDSRGLYTQTAYTNNLSIIQWARPSVTYEYERTDNSVVITNIAAVVGTLPAVEGVTFATPTLKLYYKAHGSSSETEVNIDLSTTSYTVTGLQKKNMYDFRWVVTDILGDSREYRFSVNSAQVDMHMKDAHIRFGTYVDDNKPNSFECDWSVYFGGDHFYIKDGNGNYIDILSKLRNL